MIPERNFEKKNLRKLGLVDPSYSSSTNTSPVNKIQGETQELETDQCIKERTKLKEFKKVLLDTNILPVFLQE